MAIDRDQLLIEMHADIRELRTEMSLHMKEQAELKSTVKGLDKRVTWAQGVAAAIGALFSVVIAFGKWYHKA